MSIPFRDALPVTPAPVSPAPLTDTVPLELLDPSLGGGCALLAQPGLILNRHATRMLRAAGWRLGPNPMAHLAVWGRRPGGAPTIAFAHRTGRPLLTLEDGFLRGIRPPLKGLARRHGPKQPPFLSLLLDDRGIHLDATRPSRLEAVIEALATCPLAPDLSHRAEAGLHRLRALGLSKYTPCGRGALALPKPGYVLLIDQTRGDASIHLGCAGPESFRAMLDAARAENPGCPIIIKSHPAAGQDRRRGHFTPEDLRPGETLLTAPINPLDLVDGAARVYAVTSQLGYEAVLAGRPTELFGLPFYAGWGLTNDRLAPPRFARARTTRPSREQIFAATHLIAPLYWCPYRGRLTSFEATLDALEAMARAEQGDGAAGRPLPRAVYAGFASWKRRQTALFGPPYTAGTRHRRRADTATALADSKPTGTGTPPARLWLWASRAEPEILTRASIAGIPAGLVEDGFLRSVGLGARLTDTASLVFDDLGIHYDPARPSRLEQLIEKAATFPPDDPRLLRTATLMANIRKTGVTKYNLEHHAATRSQAEATLANIPSERPLLLVPGQVADDASVRLGAANAPAQDNLALLAAARAANPDAFIVYKPHPDVEAGLRAGAIREAEAKRLADMVATRCPAAPLLERAAGLWTLTSLMGFEALLRGVPVTCLGAPFYAGWGLTRDAGPVPDRRRARPSLTALAWAALIAYPRYVDPETGFAAPPEIVLERLASGRPANRGTGLRRALSAGQDLLGHLGLVGWR
ncbi:MAG: capsular polysaccharide biosynthesis protein [Pseudomonadota bacterium]